MKLLPLILVLSWLGEAIAFAVVTKVTDIISTPKISKILLQSSVGSQLPENIDLLTKAKECAYSTTSTAIEANQYLNRILALQSNCISGTVEAGYKDLCQNVEEITDIVAQLRHKLSMSNDSTMTTNLEAGANALTINNMPALASASLLLLGLFPVISLSVLQSQWETPTVPFTAEEWHYAMKGGYLNLMISHYIRHGGL
jgi:hypothetical protein